MDIAASAGQMGLKFLGSHLPEAMKMTEKLMAGKGFNKVMSKVLPEGLGSLKGGLGKPLGDLPPGLAKLLDPSKMPPHQISTKTGLELLKQFDLNQDGQVNQQELEQGLKDNQTKISALNKKANEGSLTSQEAKELEGLRLQKRFGSSLLKHYDQIQMMDLDKTGISLQDLKNMAASDQNKSQISMRDWKNLLT